MGLFRNMSLRLKVVSIVTLVSFLSIFFTSVISYMEDSVKLKQTLINQTVEKAQLIGEYCVMPLEFGYPDRALEVLTKLKRDQSIIAGIVFDKAGKVFASYNEQEDVKEIAPFSYGAKTIFNGNRLEIFQPIIYEGKNYGSIYLKTRTTFIKVLVKQLQITFVLIGLAVLLSFLFTNIFQGYITGPVIRLSKAVQNISFSKDYSIRTGEKGKDEIGQLFENFDRMLDMIQTRDKNLEVLIESQRKTEQEILVKNDEIERQNEEYRKLNAELIRAKEKAEESDRLKTAFLANMSHEIRTPMNGIIGFAELLRNRNIQPEKRDSFLGIINASCNQLLSIINDIIDISKIEAGQVDVRYSEFRLEDMLQAIHSFFEPSAREKGLLLYVDSQNIPGSFRIKSDEVKLKQILSNLVSNAIKFTMEGEVRIGVERTIGEIRIFVSDTGIGIAKEFQSIIFSRFQQAPDSGIQGGTGLGLSISKAFAEMMGGKLWLDSEPGIGTTFWLSLPVLETRQEGKPAQIEKQGVLDLSEKTILLVEDDEFSKTYMIELLNPTGANVIHTSLGRTAINICAENKKIDLVLMDIRLPDIRGTEATREIKQNRPDLPVIAQTAYALSGDKEQVLEAGCTAYISKPVQPQYLYNLIQEWL